MNAKELDLTIRITHPSFSATEITDGIGVQPKGFREVGQVGKTPAGASIGGVYGETYWYYDLLSQPIAELAQAIRIANEWLAHRSEFLKRLVASGGSVEYYITLSSNAHFAEEFPAALLRDCGSLGVTIGFEIFLSRDS
jgi:hypothetical protein